MRLDTFKYSIFLTVKIQITANFDVIRKYAFAFLLYFFPRLKMFLFCKIKEKRDIQT